MGLRLLKSTRPLQPSGIEWIEFYQPTAGLGSRSLLPSSRISPEAGTEALKYFARTVISITPRSNRFANFQSGFAIMP